MEPVFGFRTENWISGFRLTSLVWLLLVAVWLSCCCVLLFNWFWLTFLSLMMLLVKTVVSCCLSSLLLFMRSLQMFGFVTVLWTKCLLDFVTTDHNQPDTLSDILWCFSLRSITYQVEVYLLQLLLFLPFSFVNNLISLRVSLTCAYPHTAYCKKGKHKTVCSMKLQNISNLFSFSRFWLLWLPDVLLEVSSCQLPWHSNCSIAILILVNKIQFPACYMLWADWVPSNWVRLGCCCLNISWWFS